MDLRNFPPLRGSLRHKVRGTTLAPRVSLCPKLCRATAIHHKYDHIYHLFWLWLSLAHGDRNLFMLLRFLSFREKLFLLIPHVSLQQSSNSALHLKIFALVFFSPGHLIDDVVLKIDQKGAGVESHQWKIYCLRIWEKGAEKEICWDEAP